MTSPGLVVLCVFATLVSVTLVVFVGLVLFNVVGRYPVPDSRTVLRGTFVMEPPPVAPNWQQWGEKAKECSWKGSVVPATITRDVDGSASFAQSLACNQEASLVLAYRDPSTIVLYQHMDAQMAVEDEWSLDESAQFLPKISLSPHARFAASIVTQGDLVFAEVMPIQTREMKFQNEQMQRFHTPDHDILQICFEEDDGRNMYITYVNERNEGYVVHHRHIDNRWHVVQQLKPQNPVEFDSFGMAVVARGRSLFVSCSYGILNYERHSACSPWLHWNTLHVLQFSDMLWGQSLTLSEDECCLCIASPYDTVEHAEQAGRVFLLRRSAVNAEWDPRLYSLWNPIEPQARGLFGYRMAMRGPHLFIVEPGIGDAVFYLHHYDWRTRQLVQAFDADDIRVPNNTPLPMGLGFALAWHKNKPFVWVGQHGTDEHPASLQLIQPVDV